MGRKDRRSQLRITAQRAITFCSAIHIAAHLPSAEGFVVSEVSRSHRRLQIFVFRLIDNGFVDFDDCAMQSFFIAQLEAQLASLSVPITLSKINTPPPRDRFPEAIAPSAFCVLINCSRRVRP